MLPVVWPCTSQILLRLPFSHSTLRGCWIAEISGLKSHTSVWKPAEWFFFWWLESEKKINQSGFRWKTVRALGTDLIVQETKRKSEHRITAAAGLVSIKIATATVLFREGTLCCGPCCFWKSLTVIGLSWTSCSSCIWDVKTGCGATVIQTV